jgi:hypothetical protein
MNSDEVGTALPGESRKVTIFVFAVLFFVLLVFFGPMYLRDREEKRILRDGVATTARVKGIHPTGNLHNDQPEVRITLDVDVDGGETFEGEVTTIMSPVYLPRFQPGLVVEVRFDPNDRRKVALVGP